MIYWSALWLLMHWCKSTRPSVYTMLIECPTSVLFYFADVLFDCYDELLYLKLVIHIGIEVCNSLKLVLFLGYLYLDNKPLCDHLLRLNDILLFCCVILYIPWSMPRDLMRSVVEILRGFTHILRAITLLLGQPYPVPLKQFWRMWFDTTQDSTKIKKKKAKYCVNILWDILYLTYGCWYPGPLLHQVISIHNIDYIG